MADSLAAHLSARVRGMRSSLLSRADLDSLLDRDPAGMADVLLATPYDKEMAESLTRYAGIDAVEDAATRNLINSFARLRSLGRGQLLGALTDTFLARWDLMAVKSLLRNRHRELDAETGAASLKPGPSMPPALQKDLATQPTMEALVQGLVAWNARLCRCLAAALPDYLKDRDLRVLEEALDRAYFPGNVLKLSGATDPDSRFLKGILRLEIDRINLRMLFALREGGANPEDAIQRLLPCGGLSAATLRAIATAQSPERAVEALERTPYAELAEGLAVLGKTGRFAKFDRQMEHIFLKRLSLSANLGPIGVAVLMRFAWLKYNEATNIRMMARGQSIKLARARIEEELVYA